MTEYCSNCGEKGMTMKKIPREYGKRLFKAINKFIGFWLYLIVSIIAFFPLWFIVALMICIYGWGYDEDDWIEACKSILNFQWINDNIIHFKVNHRSSYSDVAEWIFGLVIGSVFNIISIILIISYLRY